MHMRVKRMEIAFQKKKGNIEDEMDGRWREWSEEDEGERMDRKDKG
jgi:hypothetical protein